MHLRHVLSLWAWFAANASLIKGSMDNQTESESFWEFCESLNLNVWTSSSCEKHSVTVYFELENSSHSGCFQFYDVHLTEEEGDDESVYRVKYDDANHTASHTFENVSLGVYNIYIEPICDTEMCPWMHIEYDTPINMSDDSCKIEKCHDCISENGRTVTILAILCFITLLLINLLIIWPKLSDTIKDHLAEKEELEWENPTVNEDKSYNHRKNKVYIFHYHDGNGKISAKVEIIKDFLVKSSYFTDVKVIEDCLTIILFDVNRWLDHILEENENNEIAKRIILVASQQEREENCRESLENVIYEEFIRKLNDKTEQCLMGYDNLFVLLLDNSAIHSRQFQNIVRRVRYSLFGESIQNHVVNLCLNLSSVDKLEMNQEVKRIKELFCKHKIRYLGNCVNNAITV